MHGQKWQKKQLPTVSKKLSSETERGITIPCEVQTPVNMTDDEFSQAIDQDSEKPVCAELTDAEIVQQVKRLRTDRF